MKTILVTGGLGYIGSHTTVELIEAGYDVVIVDNLSNSEINTLNSLKEITGKEINFYQKDLKNQEEIVDIFRENDVNGVIHFAASKAVGESVDNPLKYYKNNLFSLINTLELMKEFNVDNIIFSSSCCVYGNPDKIPVTEKTKIKKATNPYGNTKQISENIINDYSKVGDLNAISLRYFNPVGAHKALKIGELPKGAPENLVPYITQTAAGLRDELKIFGNDYKTHDGTGVRDYIHVVDLARAHVKALDRLFNAATRSKHEIYNLGAGRGYSVLEMIKKFEEVNSIKVNYKIVDRRPGDIDEIYADSSLANKELNWKTEHSLEDMLKSAWEWEKNIRNL